MQIIINTSWELTEIWEFLSFNWKEKIGYLFSLRILGMIHFVTFHPQLNIFLHVRASKRNVGRYTYTNFVKHVKTESLVRGFSHYIGRYILHLKNVDLNLVHITTHSIPSRITSIINAARNRSHKLIFLRSDSRICKNGLIHFLRPVTAYITIFLVPSPFSERINSRPLAQKEPVSRSSFSPRAHKQSYT